MGYRSVCLLSIFVFVRIEAVPPEACFANFRWDDCGQSPVPVMYYWKPGSRCEVGLWRGCLPNLNMFPDEYECVTTCIFTARAMSSDYHSIHENEIEENTEYTTEVVTVTESGNTTDANTILVTTVSESADSNATVVSEATGGGADAAGNATTAGSNATTAGGEAAPTTAAAAA